MAIKALSDMIPYTIINVTQFPSRRKDLMALTMQMNTPQVFFNTRHVGGANEVIALLQEWEETCHGSTYETIVSSDDDLSSDDSFTLSKTRGSITSFEKSRGKRQDTVLKRYMQEVGHHPDPVDRRLAPNDSAPVSSAFFPRVSEEVQCIQLPDGMKSSVLEMTVMLKDLIKQDTDNELCGVVYKKSFYGHKLITALRQIFLVSSKGAEDLAAQLLKVRILHPVQEDIRVSLFDCNLLYRLQCNDTPGILNSFRVWSERIDPDAIRLINGLFRKLHAIEMASSTELGTKSHQQATKLPEFNDFEEAVCELQGVDMLDMNEATKLAFGINVYNLMISYAQIKIGVVPAGSKSARDAFFTGIMFNVGGHLYSFNDWENGILRGNAKCCQGSSLPFGSKDPRYQYAAEVLDPRIHFALNRGGRSSPPVHVFSAENLDKELEIVAASFCDDKRNVKFHKATRDIHVSQIFRWYRSDFGCTEKELPHLITCYMQGVKKQKLERILHGGSGDPISIQFVPFDWSSPHPTDSSVFDPSMLKMEQVRGLRSFFGRKFPSPRQ